MGTPFALRPMYAPERGVQEEGEAMTPVGGSDLFWLYAVNIALGVVTFICLFVVGAAVVRELLPRLRLSQAMHLADDHAFHTPELGATMADGGEPVDRKPTAEPPQPAK